ncbi:MAG: hypothetical protein HC906_06240 [Bacteroidales bacterium]|nr:hypothetical protein [Bacteroidales bacterium]
MNSENNKFVFAVVGAGMIARTHINNLVKSGRAEVKWVLARDMEKMKNFSKNWLFHI